MTRLVPHPLLSLVLMLVWLLLTRLSPGNLVLGLAVGLLAGWSFARLEPEGKRLRSLRPLLRLMAIVSQDILRSNLAVARLILRGWRPEDRAPFAALNADLNVRVAILTGAGSAFCSGGNGRRSGGSGRRCGRRAQSGLCLAGSDQERAAGFGRGIAGPPR